MAVFLTGKVQLVILCFLLFELTKLRTNDVDFYNNWAINTADSFNTVYQYNF